MKLNITALAAALLISSSVAHANNKISTTIDLKAYVAAGLSVGAKNKLIFGDIVQPDGVNVQEHSMTVACSTGALSYGQDTATPNGAAAPGGSSNSEKAFNFGTPQAGSVSISGEAGYGVSVSTSVSSALPEGVSFKPMLNVGEAAEGTTINAVIGTNEAVKINLCGTLTVNHKATPSSEITASANVLVSYR